ncbi:MAG: DUF1592 domain-containing protein [Pirellulaceae bacterium]
MKTVILFLVLVVLFGIEAQGADEAYEQRVLPLLERHCVDCHGASKPEQGLRLAGDGSNEIMAALRDIKSLDLIAERLRSQTMPPPDVEHPLSKAERETLLGWIDGQIDRSLGTDRNPGRVDIRRLTKVDYRNTIRDLLGIDFDTTGFPSDDVAHGFDNLAEVISLPPLLMERYADAAEELAAQWLKRELAADPAKMPSAETSPRQLAVQILLPLQERAFRRPTTELEKHYLLTFFDRLQQEEFTYEETMRACVTRILISPPFLFRIEQDGPIGQDRPLDDFELATRLSYFLWSSMPDDELWNLAQQGALQTGDQLQRQIHRMLQDPKTRQGLVENFAGQWLQTQRVRVIRPDRTEFPQFDEELRQAMEGETLALFESIVRENRPVTDLLDADYTFLNERLAKHYGIDGVQGPAFQRVSLKDLPRRGILTQASILAINSHPTRTSPVLRGKWIMEALLGTPPPPPPADVAELEAVKVEGTLRERLELHRSDARCASCHNRMDALGLAFENYDPLGTWRTTDENLPVDPSGELDEGQAFNHPLELIELLRDTQTAAFRKNLVERLLVYASGRTLGMYDRLPVRQITTRVGNEEDRLVSLIEGVVNSDLFRQRRNFGRIGIEALSEQLVFELKGNPDQQSIVTLRRNPHAATPFSKDHATFELHTLTKLLHASTASDSEVTVGQVSGGAEKGEAYRYPITAPLDEPIYLSFLEGMIGPKQYSDDFLKPISPVDPSDESRVLNITNSSHAWNDSLVGPANIRPGSLLAFDFDVDLVAKPSDHLDVFLATAGASNDSMISNSGGFKVEGEGKHRLTQVGLRKTTTHDSWNNIITLAIRTRTQTVVSNVSPIRVVRPQLEVSDSSPIRFPGLGVNQTAESPERRVFNAQKTTITDQHDAAQATLLYGMCRVTGDPKRAYFMDTEHVGLELIGPDAQRFELLGGHAIDDGQAMKLLGEDEEPGLKGGPQPEFETFQVRFRGAPQAGTFEAKLRVVTQAGNLGTPSSGEEGQPTKGLQYVEIPLEAIVN